MSGFQGPLRGRENKEGKEGQGSNGEGRDGGKKKGKGEREGEEKRGFTMFWGITEACAGSTEHKSDISSTTNIVPHCDYMLYVFCHQQPC